METQEHIHRGENPDSIEIGTPSKGGAIKIYGDFSKPAEFEAKIEAAKAVRAKAQEQLGNEAPEMAKPKGIRG